jgi:hypothetical protein
MDMSRYRANSLKTVARKSAKLQLRSSANACNHMDHGGSQPADDYTVFHGNGKAIHDLGTRVSYQQLRGENLLVIRMSYKILRGRWCDIIALNVHAPTEDKSDNTKDNGIRVVHLATQKNSDCHEYNVRTSQHTYTHTHIHTYIHTSTWTSRN